MASEEHKAIAQFLKDVHSSLRKSSLEIGAERAWTKHCSEQNILRTYAEYMQTLATTHWENNCVNNSGENSSRIRWCADFCVEYFINESFIFYRDKDIDIAAKLNIQIDADESHSHPLKALDVGSCYNPFRIYSFLDVLPIDLCPANKSVLQCDFLNVPTGIEPIIFQEKVLQLQNTAYDVVMFCFLLEYIPTSALRINACVKAYEILKPGGLLVISTPDSKHVGANCKLMKCWRYTLACMGFTRIKYEKFKHMHCMAFRKALNKDVAIRWANLHKEPYMEYAINIPQDTNKENIVVHEHKLKLDVLSNVEDFNELPFSDVL